MLGKKSQLPKRGQLQSRRGILSFGIRRGWLLIFPLLFVISMTLPILNVNTQTAFAAVTKAWCEENGTYDSATNTCSQDSFEDGGVNATSCEKHGGTFSRSSGTTGRSTCKDIPISAEPTVEYSCSTGELATRSSGEKVCVEPSNAYGSRTSCEAVGGWWRTVQNDGGGGASVGSSTACYKVLGAATATTATEGEEGEDLSCQIEGVGWILCPIFNAIGSITDASYSIVERLLTTPSSMLNRNSGGDSYTALNTAWSVVRNVANVAFVIAFLIIIYSQLTGRGMGNYGIKKMLPRLIISAILVNASFIISGIAVDISNVVGSGVSSLFSNMSSSINDASVGDISWHGGQGEVGNMFGALVTLVVSGGAAALIVGGAAASGGLWLGIATLAPILVAALFAVLTVVIVLVLRQALIVLMIVVAPLAFVAFLLPNTENLFRKWMKLFMVLLAMFPAVALVFSVSKLAGAIVMASSDDFLVQIAGAGMTIIPLFITPVIMKTAGGTLNRLTGVLNIGAGKGLTARAKQMRKRAFENVSDQRMGNYNRRGLTGFLARAGSTPRTINNRLSASRERSKFKAGTVESEQKLASNENYRQNLLEMQNDESQRDPTRAEQRLISQIRGQAQSDEQVEVKNAKAEFQNQNPDELKKSLESAINSGDNVKVMASLELLTTKGDYGMKVIDQTLQANESAINQQFAAGNKGIRNDIAGTLQGTGAVSKSETLKAWAGSVKSDGTAEMIIEKDAEGNPTKTAEMTFGLAQQTAMGKAGGLAAAKFANQSAHEQSKMISSGNISPEQAADVLSSTNAGTINADVVKDLKRIRDGAANPAAKLTQTQPQSSQTSANNDGTLSIPHDNTSSQNQSVSAKQAAPAAAQSPQQAFNPQPDNWVQTDSGLSIPRSAAPTQAQQAPVAPPQAAPVQTTQQTPVAPPQAVPVQTTQQPAPTPTATQQSPAQPVVVQQAAPAQPAQPQKINVEVDTSNIKREVKDIASDMAAEIRRNNPTVPDKLHNLAEEKRRKRPDDSL